MDALMETTCFNVIALEPPKQLAASVLLQKQEKKKKKLGRGSHKTHLGEMCSKQKGAG